MNCHIILDKYKVKAGFLRVTIFVLASMSFFGCDQSERANVNSFDTSKSVPELLSQYEAAFSKVTPNYQFIFPDDHLAHNDFRLEWWYFTANLYDDNQQHYGVHWTLFRQAMFNEKNLKNTTSGNAEIAWTSNQFWMAHGALSLPDNHIYEERFARGGIGQAGVELNSDQQFDAWLDDWQFKGTGMAPVPGTLSYSLEDYKIQLSVKPGSEWIFHGENGFSQKSLEGNASYYYSMPKIKVSATLQRGEQTIALQGIGWLDREWSSQPLAQNQQGWDWFSLKFKNGDALMVFRLRRRDGINWHSGTWIPKDGKTIALKDSDIYLEPKRYQKVELSANRIVNVPLVWELSIPTLNHSWEIQARYKDHWLETLLPYWEGPVIANGTNQGEGFLEMTGYPVISR